MADITWGTTVVSDTAGGLYNQAIRLSANRIVHFWLNSSGHPYARVYTEQDRALTAVASEQELQAQDFTNGKADNPPMAIRINDDAFAVVFTDTGSNVAIKIWSENDGTPGTFDLEETNILDDDVLSYQYYPCICEVNTNKFAIFFVHEVIATGVKTFVGYGIRLSGYTTAGTKTILLTAAEWSVYAVGPFPRAAKIASATSKLPDRLAVMFKNTVNNKGVALILTMKTGLLEMSRKLYRKTIQIFADYTIGHFNLEYISDTKLAVIFERTDSLATIVKVGSITNLLMIDFGNADDTSFTTSANCLRILRVSDRAFYVGFIDKLNNYYGYVSLCNVSSGNAITVNSIDSFRNAAVGGSDDWGLDLVLSRSATLVVAFQDTSQSDKPKLRAGDFLLPNLASTFFSSDDNAHMVYRHDGFSEEIVSCYSAPGTPASSGVFGIAWDGDNIISADNENGKIYKMFTFTSSIYSSFAYAGTIPRDIDYDSATGYLYSIDADNDFIYEHNGFGATILSSFSSPSSNPIGITFDSINFYSSDRDSDKIYQHSSFTNEIKHSIAAPNGAPNGICIAGLDLYSCDVSTDILYRHEGFSATIISCFSSPGSIPRSVACEAGAFSRRPIGDTNPTGEESILVLTDESGGSGVGDDVGETTATASPDIVSFHIDLYEEFDERARMDARSNNGNLIYYTAGTKRKFVLGVRNIVLSVKDKLEVLYNTQGTFDFFRRSTDRTKAATVKWVGDFDLHTPTNQSRQFTDLLYQGTILLEET